MEEKVKIGFIGLGRRGSGCGMVEYTIGLLGNLINNDDVEITAICDSYKERIEFAENRIVEKGRKKPFETTNYEEVLNCDVDAVIVCTNWAMHVEIALASMEKHIPVAIEVGGSHNLEDLWKLVECYERTKTPFMFLENCCYNKDELLVSSLIKNGKMGKISYCQGGYCHDLRNQITETGIKRNHYRLNEYKNYNCENYPTHELGPMVKYLGITRGNRFTKLVSMASKQQGIYDYLEKHPEFSQLNGVEFKQGDVVTTMIECENGETITIKLDTTLPRFYDRGLIVSGTNGFYCQTTKTVYIDGVDNAIDSEFRNELINNQDNYNKYLPNAWKNITEEQLKTGHGGMDFIMLKCFVQAVKEKQEMPIDVYEACAMMCVTALSEQSIKLGSMPVEIPDFTNGEYKKRKPLDVMELPEIK